MLSIKKTSTGFLIRANDDGMHVSLDTRLKVSFDENSYNDGANIEIFEVRGGEEFSLFKEHFNDHYDARKVFDDLLESLGE